MELQYLVFDASDEDCGRGSFDAMATVAPGRLPALLAEIAAVLRWARGAFGPAQPEGEWDFALQAVAEPDEPVPVRVDEATGEVSLGAPAGGAARLTVSFTLSGSAAFCQALGEAFVTH